MAGRAQENEEYQRQLEVELAQVRQRMAQIKHKILVLSGKGGVGKSTVAVNLALSLSLAGKRTGLLDIATHGPSVPKILNLEGRMAHSGVEAILPIEVGTNLKVMSIAFFLTSPDDAVIWRGPMKYQMIKQFLKDVQWGELDYLIIDSPPGTGDEPLSIIQLLENADGAVVVTTPQEVALADVRKSITFCRSLNLPVLGVLENMSGFVCPKCGERTDIFKSGGGENMALSMNVPFLGRIPIDPQIVEACDSGQPYVDKYRQSQAAKAFNEAVARLVGANGKVNTAEKEGDQQHADRDSHCTGPVVSTLRTLRRVRPRGCELPGQMHLRDLHRSGSHSCSRGSAPVARPAEGECGHRRRDGQSGAGTLRPERHRGRHRCHSRHAGDGCQCLSERHAPDGDQHLRSLIVMPSPSKSM